MNEIIVNETAVTLIPSEDIVSNKACALSQDISKVIDNYAQVIIDMRFVTLIDSTGIGLIISAQNKLHKRDAKLKLTNVSDDILTMFKIMRLDKHLYVN